MIYTCMPCAYAFVDACVRNYSLINLALIALIKS